MGKLTKPERAFDRMFEYVTKRIKGGIGFVKDHFTFYSGKRVKRLERENQRLQEDNYYLQGRIDVLKRNTDSYRGLIGSRNSELEKAIERYENITKSYTEKAKRVSELLDLVNHLKKSRRASSIEDIMNFIKGYCNNFGLAAGIVDSKDRIAYANPVLLDITGYSEKELVGERYTKFLAGEETIITRHFRNSKVQIEDRTIIGKDHDRVLCAVKIPFIDVLNRKEIHLFTLYILQPKGLNKEIKRLFKVSLLDEEESKQKRDKRDLAKILGEEHSDLIPEELMQDNPGNRRL